MTNDTIISDIENATGPSRILDAALHVRRFGLRQGETIETCVDDYYIRYYAGPIMPYYMPLPRYTGTIDAALLLIPDGWRIHTIDASDEARVSCTLVKRGCYPIYECETACTIPTSICSAVLRLLAAGDGAGEIVL